MASTSQRRAMAWFIGIAIAGALIDQFSKYLVLSRLGDGSVVKITSFLNFVLAYNRGAAFGFLNDASGWQLFVFVAVAVFVVVYLVRLVWREAHESGLQVTGYGLIAAGALGNVVDRLNRGFVVDFIDVHFAGWHFWVFNIADAALSVGVALLFVSLWLDRESAASKAGG